MKRTGGLFQLYRFYDQAGTLLYVGISLNTLVRATQHRLSKPWWKSIARIEITDLGHMNREAAEAIERDVIVAERPLHNVVHTERAKRQFFPADRLAAHLGMTRPELSRAYAEKRGGNPSECWVYPQLRASDVRALRDSFDFDPAQIWPEWPSNSVQEAAA